MSILKYTDLENAARERTGGPAFPGSSQVFANHDAGMTLRDYFAGQALAGICSTLSVDKIGGLWDGGMREARSAYALADAMLEARKL
jgi:hypothetical protein